VFIDNTKLSSIFVYTLSINPYEKNPSNKKEFVTFFLINTFFLLLDPQHIHNDNDYQEKFPNVCDAFTQNAGKCCSEKTLKRRLPILTWMPKYTFQDLFYDTVAGLSVGLTVIPQGEY